MSKLFSNLNKSEFSQNFKTKWLSLSDRGRNLILGTIIVFASSATFYPMYKELKRDRLEDVPEHEKAYYNSENYFKSKYIS